MNYLMISQISVFKLHHYERVYTLSHYLTLGPKESEPIYNQFSKVGGVE